MRKSLRPAKTVGTVRSVFCVPYAISVLTGKKVTDIENLVNQRRKRRKGSPVRGLYPYEYVDILEILGCRVRTEVHFKYPEKGITLARWLRERRGDALSNTYLVRLRGHVVVVKGRKFIDNHTREPVFISKAPGRRCRVKQVYRIEER